MVMVMLKCCTVIAGLAFSWFGDLFLAFRGKETFLAGLVSFLLAHCMYCAGFYLVGIDWQYSIASLSMSHMHASSQSWVD